METNGKNDKYIRSKQVNRSYCKNYSAKLYGSRGGRRVKKAIQKSIQELENEGDEGIENNNTSNIV